jgi:hypothetical protein
MQSPSQKFARKISNEVRALHQIIAKEYRSKKKDFLREISYEQSCLESLLSRLLKKLNWNLMFFKFRYAMFEAEF